VAGIKSNKRKSTIKQYGGGALGVGLGAIGGGVVGAAGSLGALLGGAGTPKKGYSGGGNFGYSKTAPKGSIKKSDPSALGKLWDSSARMRQQQAQLRAQADQKPVEEDTSTPFDNLWSLLQQGGGSFDPNNVQVDTSAYDSQEKTARQNGADADAKLNAMYRQLAQSYLDDNADTKAAYAQTRASVGQAADQATNDIKSSYTSSTNDLNSMLSKLGIQDTAKVIGNKGTSLQGDQAATLSGVAANKGANLAATDANSAAAQEYNRNISSAAKLEGATQRAGNQQNLSKVLASIAAARTNAVNSARQSAAQAAASSQGDTFSSALALAKAQQDYLQNQQELKNDSAAAQAKQDASDFQAAQGLNKQNSSRASQIAGSIAQFMRNGMSYEDALKRAQALYGK
jgi:hypothetical protein